jgi:hypothetical protein
MDKTELFKKLEEFLEDRVSAGPGGDYMAKPTQEHMESMYEIFYGIIELKFEGDCDGDSPVHINLTDLNKYLPLFYSFEPMPMIGGLYGDEKRDVLNKAVKNSAANIKEASNNLGRYLEILENMDMRGE